MVTLKQLFQVFGHDPKWGRLATQSAQPMVSVFMRKLGDTDITTLTDFDIEMQLARNRKPKTRKTMPKLTLNYACIVDVMQVEPKPTDNQRKNRKVILHVDEEDLFDMFDQLNPKNIVKYLDMRGIKHREPANLVVKVKPDASGLKLRHSLKRVAQELRNARKQSDD